jgi:aminocarboxymuconate-semialdehyde decarboxylase
VRGDYKAMVEHGPEIRVDFHTHVFPDGLPRLAERHGDERWPYLEKDGDNSAQIMVGKVAYRKIGVNAWLPDRRLEDMNSERVDVQVISPTPITFCYWGKAEATLELSRFQNDFIAAFVRRNPLRFIGLGTVPLHAPELAIAEMRRALRELELAGIEIGATVNGRGLHIPELRPFFRAAVELSCPIFVHPTNEPWAVSEREKYSALGGLHQATGMPGETAFAAATLMLGGVMSELPQLRICLAHGGGSLCLMVPRMAMVWNHVPGARNQLKQSPMELVRLFWADTLTFDVDNLVLLKTRYGSEKLMVGSDYPFDGCERPAGAIIDRAAGHSAFSRTELSEMRGVNALRFLGLEGRFCSTAR